MRVIEKICHTKNSWIEPMFFSQVLFFFLPTFPQVLIIVKNHFLCGLLSKFFPGLSSYEASRSRPVSRVGGRAVENERSAPALRAHTSQREASKHASQSEAMRSSRSVIYMPEERLFLKRRTFGLPPNAPHFLSALPAWLRGKSRFFFFEHGII